MDVVALGASCDLDLPEDGVASGASSVGVEARSGWSAAQAGEATPSPGGVHFRVREFAVLADGRRVTLRDDLGFSSWSRSFDARSGRTTQLDPWAHLERESVLADVRAVVLPDDDSSDEHPYAWLRELLRREGVETTEAHLRGVPYVIELSERLEQRLAAEGT